MLTVFQFPLELIIEQGRAKVARSMSYKSINERHFLVSWWMILDDAQWRSDTHPTRSQRWPAISDKPFLRWNAKQSKLPGTIQVVSLPFFHSSVHMLDTIPLAHTCPSKWTPNTCHLREFRWLMLGRLLRRYKALDIPQLPCPGASSARRRRRTLLSISSTCASLSVASEHRHTHIVIYTYTL